MKKLYFEGGFHNSPKMHIQISDSAAENYEDVKKGLVTKDEFIDTYLSNNQKKRLDKHFCGNKECHCGGWERADMWIEQ